MKLVKTLIAIAAIGVGSEAFGKAYPGLEVGFTFREVAVLVEDQHEYTNKLGLTNESIERTVKLKLLTRGLKLIPAETIANGFYLYIRIQTLPIVISEKTIGFAVKLHVDYCKYPSVYGIPADRGLGYSVNVVEGSGSIHIVGEEEDEEVLRALEANLDKFILDYLESNLKYEATLKNKKLRDIDLVIKGAADAMTKDGYGIGIDSIAKGNHRRWYKRYNALMKPKKPTTPEGTFENDLLPRRLP